MAQNIYDNPVFYNEFAKLPSQTKGLDGAPEWPMFRSLLPDLHGCSVLDLGCGAGWASRWAVSHGAKSVLGIDISHNMLEKAESLGHDKVIEYKQADLEIIELEKGNFDVVISNLALHYIVDFDRVLEQVFKSLKQGGCFVFSVEHPMYTSATNPAWNKIAESPPNDNYLQEGPRVTNWLADGVLKQHHTFSTYFHSLLKAGLVVKDFEEWGPDVEEAERSEQLADHRGRPRFLLMKALKSLE